MPRRGGYSYKPSNSYGEQSKEPICSRDGCMQIGEFRAPLSRNHLNQYQMLCQEHIAEFNKKWDYFSGMSQHEIEDFQKDAFTGHRPTWRPDMRNSEDKLRAAFNTFMDGDVPEGLARAASAPPIPQKQRKALAILDLEHPVSFAVVKKQYKKLVKKHHPDVNRDNPKAEDLFKEITQAYRLLLDEYEEVTEEL